MTGLSIDVVARWGMLSTTTTAATSIPSPTSLLFSTWGRRWTRQVHAGTVWRCGGWDAPTPSKATPRLRPQLIRSATRLRSRLRLDIDNLRNSWWKGLHVVHYRGSAYDGLDSLSERTCNSRYSLGIYWKSADALGRYSERLWQFLPYNGERTNARHVFEADENQESLWKKLFQLIVLIVYARLCNKCSAVDCVTLLKSRFALVFLMT